MKKTLILITITTGFLVLFSCRTDSPKPGWKGKLGKEAGVTVVNNPVQPVFGLLNLELEEELSIGGENRPETLLGSIVSLAVDGEGNIYLGQMKPPALQLFNPAGKYLKTIGGFGQGPGEYQSPRALYIGPDGGTLYLRDDIFKILVYRLDGTYLREINLSRYCYDFLVDSQGFFWGIMSIHDENGQFKSLEKIGPDGKSLFQVVKKPYELYTRTQGQSVMSISTGYEYDLMMTPLDKDSLVFGYSKEYELTVMSFDGQAHLIIKNQQKARPIPREELVEIGKYLNISEQPFFYRLLTDDLGRIWVLRDYPGARGKSGLNPKEYDVYSRDGYYLYRTSLPFGRRLLIRNGQLWATYTDEEKGLIMVKRLRIKNWDKIRYSLE
ncbi:MAG: 6-bladed beta-propeller [Candidatus Saccharicenans sp.]|nr:6-bladed beta-propeller [Candidatus Saccharicenans sp.]